MNANPFEMVEGIREVINSRKFGVPVIESLTKREDQILHLMAAGFTGYDNDISIFIFGTLKELESASGNFDLSTKIMLVKYLNVDIPESLILKVKIGNSEWRVYEPLLPRGDFGKVDYLVIAEFDEDTVTYFYK